jgi:hypothetical protein
MRSQDALNVEVMAFREKRARDGDHVQARLWGEEALAEPIWSDRRRAVRGLVNMLLDCCDPAKLSAAVKARLDREEAERETESAPAA